MHLMLVFLRTCCRYRRFVNEVAAACRISSGGSTRFFMMAALHGSWRFLRLVRRGYLRLLAASCERALARIASCSQGSALSAVLRTDLELHAHVLSCRGLLVIHSARLLAALQAVGRACKLAPNRVRSRFLFLHSCRHALLQHAVVLQRVASARW